MSEKQEAMQDEINTLKQRLEKSMIILEHRNIDPGEQILADAEEACKIREETKTATDHLLTELKIFNSKTKEQKRLVQSINSKWKEAAESRKQFVEEQKAFQADMEKFRSSLEETEKWLDL
ncbi:PREDICTED: small kinetochore-associated protein-like [Nanorana parkeri]|uniref:small kinetochore-associated protein-like n=1 Tax=Nanorana parkeri TaxID=125878 RepID=UPI000854585C|nr:PREDICTED: small kinetochore-associated protein-like [Nanorana parkeri]